jgi:hypothetical protein
LTEGDTTSLADRGASPASATGRSAAKDYLGEGAVEPRAEVAPSTRFWVENDNLSDDWCAFPTHQQAQDFVRACCRDIAACNVDDKGIGNVPAFQGLTTEEIVEKLYQENVDCIEERP